jgi:hypothetical protein
MAYFQFTKVKQILGQTGTSNDDKIQHYGEMADTYINSYLTDVRNIAIPVDSSDFTSTQEFNVLLDIANQLTVAYFYKFESGDTSTADQAEAVWLRFFTSKWQRPRFKARGAEF